MSRERVIPVRIERGPSPAVSVHQNAIPVPAPVRTERGQSPAVFVQQNAIPAPAPPPPPPQPPQPQATFPTSTLATVAEQPAATVTATVPPAVQHNTPSFKMSEPGPEPPPSFRRSSASLGLNGEIGDKIVNMLDEIERRVENLRETASLMEQEKESLIEILNNVQLNKDLLQISQGEKEDIEVTTNRLLTRCRTVAVSVSTVRNKEQEKALYSVNSQIDELINKMKEDIEASKEACKKFLNACNPDQPDGPIDQRFQSMVIECTADDQKKIRKRLEQLFQVINRTDKTIAQAN